MFTLDIASSFKRKIFILLYILICPFTAFGQGTEVSFSGIPKSGTILIYSHMDDDLIWMLPWWVKTEKFIGGAMPATPGYAEIISQQQALIDDGDYGINYESNWYVPWDQVTDAEYSGYYWDHDEDYSYMELDHLETKSYDETEEVSEEGINKIKAKLEQYFAANDMSRAITHNIWGEYGHKHHKAVNKASRELAVKYRKDIWMLGCDNGGFNDVDVPNGVTYTTGSFNTPDLYTGIRTIYQNNGRWTWYDDYVPSGEHIFIKIVDHGVDRSALFTGESVTTSGPVQDEPGSYIFDGDDDYMTLRGNNYSSFTIAMRVRPDQIRSMDIARMAEYPLASATDDRNIYINSDGRVTARIFDGSPKVLTSITAINEDTWSHIAITSDGSFLKLYVNGALQGTCSTGSAITSYNTPEFVLGQAMETGEFFDGQINEVLLYNHVLSDSEIATLSRMIYTVTSSAGSGGSISPLGSTTLNVGTNMTCTITPESGNKITDVKVDGVSVGPVTTYTFNFITSNHTIEATFSPITCTITSTATSGGSISPSGQVEVIQGSGQTFHISANTGFIISDVLVDNNSVGAVTSYTFTDVISDHTISASFAIITFTITATAGSGGSITPSGINTVNYGTDNTFTVAPETDYKISEVKVDDVSAGTPSSYTFNDVTANHVIAAAFTPIIKYTITSEAGAGGTINPSGISVYNEGTSQTYNITAGTGYRISDVKVDEVSVGCPASYTFNNLSASHFISVTFAEIPVYTITASAGTGGSISPEGNAALNEGSSQSYTITAGSGYRISDVLVDNISAGRVSEYTFGNIAANHSIAVNFELIPTYVITASAGTGGSISPNGAVTCQEGETYPFLFLPDAGYHIEDVLVDNVSAGAISGYTFSNITANHVIVVNFEINSYTITASTGTGGAISSPGPTIVNYGDSYSYTISPNMGYLISDVRVDNVSVGTPSTYTFSNITTGHTIAAAFSLITYPITASAGTGGSISPDGTSYVGHGTSRTFTITPDAGYVIADVIADNVSQGAVSSFTFSNVAEAHTISASFRILTYVITCSAGANGTITPAGDVTVNYGTSRTITITPNTGFTVSDVLVDNVSVGALSTYTFNNIVSGHSISATFEIAANQLVATAGSGGSVSPSGSVSVNYGSSYTFTITPNTGYVISDVRIDNVSVGTPSTYTFNNVTSGHTIAASFTLITFQVTATAGTGGSISPQGSVSVSYGTSRTFNINPAEGYAIADVLADNVSQGAVTSYTFSNVTGPHTISATFRMLTYTVTTNAGTGGSVTPAGSQTVNHGTNRTISITPDIGFVVADVLVDGVSAGAVTTYSLNNITSNHIISATFEIVKNLLTSSAGEGGSISPSGSLSADYGTNNTYTIHPDAGYEISDVIVDNISVGTPSSYTFNNVVTGHTITATFSLIKYSLSGSAGTGGTISPSGIVAADHGSDHQYVVTASRGYVVDNVIVDGVSQGAITSFTFTDVTADHEISASFRLLTYNVTGTAGTGGTITPDGPVTVNYGAGTTITITPNAGYWILDVLVDNVSVGAISKYTLNNITSDHSVSAAFVIITNSLLSSAGNGGSISPSGSIPVTYGSDYTYNITPVTGYEISDVLVDGVSVGTPSVYTFSNITSGHTITATFRIRTFSVTAVAGQGGTIDPAGTSKVKYGEGLTFTITPEYGFTVNDLKIDNVSYGAVDKYTIENIKAEHSVLVTFSQITRYLIVAGSGPGGSIDPAGSVAVYDGTDQTFTINPDKGYRISEVLVDNKSIGSVSEFSFEGVTGDHSIYARFTTNTAISVYPNPFRDNLNIRISTPDELLFEIRVSDFSGKKVYSESRIQGNVVYPISLSIPQGFYLLRVYQEGMEVGTLKIIRY